MGPQKPIITSLSLVMKKAITVTEDVKEAKAEHRKNLKVLLDKYMDDVSEGKAEGIRNAKELVEVIKADLLLMGEATDRTDMTPDDIRIAKITKMIDGDNPELQIAVKGLLQSMNQINDTTEDGDEETE